MSTERPESPRTTYLLRTGEEVGEKGHADRFTIEQPIGRGAHSQVYLATDHLVERPVALKFLQLGEGEVQRAQAIHEARLLRSIRHPNVVTVFDVLLHPFTSEDRELPPCLVMEYVEGNDLAGILRRHPDGMPVSEVLTLLNPVAGALVACHRAGVLHRDIKPGNILVDNDGVVKLSDFGVARSDSVTRTRARLRGNSDEGALPGRGGRAPASSQSGSGVSGDGPVGTPNYLAPEVWRGEEADARSDIFAFGVVLFRALTGQVPVAAKTIEELRQRLEEDRPLTEVRTLKPEVSPLLADVVSRCLALRPEGRYENAEDLLAGLEQAVRHGARALPPAPYLGLKTFDGSDDGVFFGREEEVARLLSRFKQERAITLVGDSGSGKSSLAKAGLEPAILAGDLGEGRRWGVVRVRPGRAPLKVLARGLAGFAHREEEEILSLLEESPERLSTVLGVRGDLGRRRQRDSQEHKSALFLIIDPFEELVTLCADSTVQRRFGLAVQSLTELDLPLRVLLVCRSDYLSRVAQIPGLETSLQVVHLVRALDGEALRASIVSPARAFGFRFETEGMVDRLMRDVAGRAGAMALLQFYLKRLWSERDTDRRVLPAEALERVGSIGELLAREAEQVYATLEELGLGEITERALLALVSQDGTRMQVRLEELQAAALGGRVITSGAAAGSEWVNGLLEELDGRTPQAVKLSAEVETVVLTLRRAGLVVGGDDSLELAHETLIFAWKRLSDLLSRTRAERQLVAEVEAAAKTWEAWGRPASLLWRQPQLRQVEEGFWMGHLEDAGLTGRGEQFLHTGFRAERRSRLLRKGGLLLSVSLVTAFVVYSLGLEGKRSAAERSRARTNVALALMRTQKRAAGLANSKLKKERRRLQEQVTMNEKLYRKAIGELRSYHQHVIQWRNLAEALLQGVLEKGLLDRELLLRVAKQTYSPRLERWTRSELRSLSAVRTERYGRAAFHTRSRPPPAPSPRANVIRFLRRHLGELRHCYLQARARRPDIQGRILASFAVRPGGRLSPPTLFSTVPGTFTDCVKARLSGWRLNGVEEHYFMQIEADVDAKDIKVRIIDPSGR